MALITFAYNSSLQVGDHNGKSPRTKPPSKTRASCFHGKPGFVQACKTLHEKKIPIVELEYRAKGHFTGRELYFYEPSGNRLEIRDPTWKKEMPEPPCEEIVKS